RGEQHLEAAVESKPVDDVGADPSPHTVSGFEHAHRSTGPVQYGGAGQPGEPGADDDDGIVGTHQRSSSARSAAARSTCSNANPSVWSTDGWTRCPSNSSASASSPPSRSFGPNFGTGTMVGRPSTSPSVSAKSALRTGFGAVRLTGPLTELVRRCSTARTWSVREIQLIHCLPLPNLPPAPSLKIGSIFLSAPPFGVRTMPVRMWATRTPASLAAAVAASHRWQISARNPAPAGADSSTTSSPRS